MTSLAPSPQNLELGGSKKEKVHGPLPHVKEQIHHTMHPVFSGTLDHLIELLSGDYYLRKTLISNDVTNLSRSAAGNSNSYLKFQKGLQDQNLYLRVGVESNQVIVYLDDESHIIGEDSPIYEYLKHLIRD